MALLPEAVGPTIAMTLGLTTWRHSRELLLESAPLENALEFGHWVWRAMDRATQDHVSGT